jgi:pimeloyl-ACP methyl ester carboxylesterase
MDNAGYGRSTRPSPMNDPCNLASDQQVALNLDNRAEPCAPSYGAQMTTIRSDWDEIGAVVDHLLALRHVPRVSLAAWSLGGPRAGGYAVQHPDKVQNRAIGAGLYP